MTVDPSAEPDLSSPELIIDPYAGFGRLRERAPVLRGRTEDGTPAWLVTRYRDVRAVLSDHRFVTTLASVPAVGVDDRNRQLELVGVPAALTGYLTGTIQDVDGPAHVRLRKLVTRAFTARRVAALRPRVEQITHRLLDELTAPVDLIEDFAYPLPITVICELIGVPETDRPAWRRWGTALVTMNPHTLPGAVAGMVEHAHDLARRRRMAPADDLVTELAHATDDEGNQLTDTELVATLHLLVIAGHETTAHLIGNGALALLTHPDQLELLRRDPRGWPAAVHELMRWCGPLLTRLRYAATDVELGGVRIQAGEAVQVVLVSANFDPREFSDPDRFDVTRQPPGGGEGHVGFGYGPHYCLGAALARQEAEVALRALFERYPRLALDVDEPAWVPMPGMRLMAELPVRLG